MSSKEFRLLQHEARWAFDFISRFGPEKPGIPELREKLQTTIADRDRLAVELTEDELKLCVEGYEDQAATLWLEDVDVDEGLRKDEQPRFTKEQTEMYHRMKATLEAEGRRAG